MDSDDNCLVIDESAMHMEVSSTTQSRSTTPVRSMEIDNDVSQQETGADESATRHSDSYGDGIPSVDSTPRKKKDKSKNKSKDEKKNSKTPSKENRSRPSTPKRPNSIRLSKTAFNEKWLSITAPKHKMFNMQLSTKNGVLYGNVPAVYPAPAAFPDLSLEQLLNWPGMKMLISLDHMTFTLELKDNVERAIVFGDDPMVDIIAEPNPTELQCLQRAPSTKMYPYFSKEMIETYIATLKDAAQLYEVGPSKLREIEHTFQKILDNVARVPFSNIQTRITHSQFLNEQKYYRIFDNNAGVGDDDDDGLKVRLRETINPQALFCFPGCIFISEEINLWSANTEEYFSNIFGRRQSSFKDKLRDRYKKCVSLTCENCHEHFEGALWAVKLKDHIQQKHLVDMPWTCVKCQRQWGQFELLQMGWKHDCTEAEQTK